MKFKNYTNPFTKDNRIYSDKDIINMSVGNFIKKTKELLGQKRTIGIPSVNELKVSGNAIWINEYIRDDGTRVCGHWRSKPESRGIVPSSDKTADETYIPENKGKGNDMYEINFTKPVEGKITSNFGYRLAPINGASTGHSGIDIGVPEGTPVKVIADGVVVAASGSMRGYGSGVFVDHGMINGKHVVSEYGHLSKYDVKVGDKVKAGQIIAKSGNTGISTGPHLHLTIRENGIPVNPINYVGKFNY